MSRQQSFTRLAAFLGAAGLCTALQAEVVLDGSMGTGGPVAGPNFDITQGLGQTVGNNLFHSFSSFNISNTESATFSGNATINNVISRVTGGTASTINGQISSTIPTADFFFINPAGLVFGDNASINVNGSFYAGTADYISLNGNGRFDAINPAASTLTIDPPTAFGFYAGPPAGIDVGDSLLQTQQSQTLALIGGDITITDGNLYAPDGQVVLASVASAGEVALDPDMLSLNGFQSLGTINITNPSGKFPFLGLGEVGNLDVSTIAPLDGVGGGRIIIRGGNFFLHDGLVRAEVIENIDGRGIDIQARNEIRLSGFSRLLSRVLIAAGNAGPVTLQSDTLRMTDRAAIASDAKGTGNGGTIDIIANTITMEDQTSISSDTDDQGQGGNLVLTSGQLSMSDDAVVKTSTIGTTATGNAGNITILVPAVILSGDATINSSSELGSQGQAGTVTVTSDNLQMMDEAWIISYTETDRDAGSITINTTDMSMQDQSVISTSTFAAGNGGTIIINTGTLTLDDTAVITSGTEGTGNAGSVIINAGNLTASNTTTISSESEGGNFFVRGTPDLSSATGGGDGGTVQVNATNVILNENAGIASGTAGAGAGGNVGLVVDKLDVNNNASISAVSTGTGVAGDINISATDAIQLNGGSITTATTNADGGNIAVNANELVYLLNAVISTSVQGGLGNGGNITIDPVFVILNNSNIIANAFGGDGGNILIVAENYFQDQNSIVQASSTLGIDGTVTITSPDENVSGNLAELPESLLAVTRLASQQCDLRTRKDISSLVLVGQDGLPPSPDDFVTVRIPVHTDEPGTVAGNTHPGKPVYPLIRLDAGYRPGELVVLNCSH